MNIENSYMSKTIGIFQGKQAKWNILILQTLYDNGPLTAWGIVGIVHSKGRKDLDYQGKVSLHATFNKSLRRLEKKGYTLKNKKQWALNFKGLLANIIQNPRPWSEKWTQEANRVFKTLGVSANFNLEDFRSQKKWTRLAALAKKLMEEGVINFDIIKNKTLMTLLMAQDRDDALDKLLH
jgi:hypothetical protein